MSKHLKGLALVFAALIALGVLSTRVSFITVHNNSGTALTGVFIRAEAFTLPCGTLAPGENRWFVRWARGNCSLGISGRSNGTLFSGGGGYLPRDTYGKFIRLTVQADFSIHVHASPVSLGSEVVDLH